MKKAWDQDLTHSRDALKVISIKIVPQVVIHHAYGTWHSLCTVTSIHSVKKSTKISQELGNKLVDGRKFKGQNRKIEFISKKVWRKKKREKMFRLRTSLLLHVKQYKNCCWRTFVIKKQKNLNSAGRWSDEVAR